MRSEKVTAEMSFNISDNVTAKQLCEKNGDIELGYRTCGHDCVEAGSSKAIMFLNVLHSHKHLGMGNVTIGQENRI
jgi:hypothetical protein